jgi:glycosyltransferase involved in cell wall biosynthesis
VRALLDHGPVGVFGLRADAPSPPPRPGIEVWTSATDPSLTDPAVPTSLEWMKDPEAVPSDRYLSPASAAEVSSVVEDFSPDVVVVADLSLHQYAAVVEPSPAAVVLDCHQVESAHLRQLALQGPPAARLVRSRLADRLTAREADVLPSVDQVWACSAEDADALGAAHVLRRPVEVVPNTVDIDRYWRAEAPEPHTIVFPAMFGYPPSQAAALVLAQDVLPDLARRFDDARLELVGRNPSPTLLEAVAGDPRVTVTGAVPDVRPHLAAGGAMAAPITAGGGTRLKVLESFASRLPVVSTAKGVAGLEVEEGIHHVGAEDPPAFVDQLTRLWTHPAAAHELSERAHELVQERYSSDAARRAVAAALDHLGR